MREYGKVTPRFWTGQLGKSIRGNAYAQALASYLVNCPHGNMIGLFHLPFTYMQADLGWTLPRIRQTLQSLPSDFVLYDYINDRVLILEAWRIELCKDDMGADDNRRKQVANLVRANLASPLANRFLQRYPKTRAAVSDLLPASALGPPEPLDSPSEAPSEGLSRARAVRAQDQDQEQQQEQIPPSKAPRGGASGEPGFTLAEIEWRVAETWAAHLEATRRHYRGENGSDPTREPTRTPEIEQAIKRSLRLYDRGLLDADHREQWKRESKTRAAGIGIFLSDWHAGRHPKNDPRNGGKPYLEHWRPWKAQKGKGDPVEEFAELYFRERSRRAARG